MISNSPILHHWTDENIFRYDLVENPKFDKEQEVKAQEYMKKLIADEIGDTVPELDENSHSNK